MNFSSAAAVETKAESEPPTSLSGNFIDCLGPGAHRNIARGKVPSAARVAYLSLLEGLEFTPPSSARTKGDIYVPGTTNILFLIFRLMRYSDICFFSLPGVLFPRE